jgi:hypothetical protein
LFERRKRECLQAGYLVESEQPIPINGLCSFVAFASQLRMKLTDDLRSPRRIQSCCMKRRI